MQDGAPLELQQLHNARPIVTDLHRVGPLVWTRFNGDRNEKLW